MNEQKSNYEMTIKVIALLFIIWGIFGMLDAKNYTYAGFNTNDDWSVNRIEPNSPAESAGLKVGDIIKSTDGVDVKDSKALNARERATIGQTREFFIDRNGEEITLQLTYSGMPDKNKTNVMVGFIIGLLFIVIGVYANYKHKSQLSTAFAVFSICFGFLFLNGPYLGTGPFSTFIGIVSIAVVLFSFTALVIYMLSYPPESRFINGKNKKLTYVPMIIILVIVIVIRMTQMDNSASLRMGMRLLFGIFIISYFLIALITLIRKYTNANTEERSSKGLTLMMLGAIIGLVPILIYFSASTISPGIQLPGNDYVFYTFAAIPIFFMLALNKLHASS